MNTIQCYEEIVTEVTLLVRRQSKMISQL